MAALAVALVSCTGRRVKSERVITVTIEPLRYFTEQIAGDRFKVVTMVPVGGNPETYEPSARQMMDLSQSDMYVKVGSIGFERTWMKRLEANAPHAIVVDSSEGIGMISTGHGYDPHTWMSTSNARVIARNIYSALVSIDARDSVYFRENLERLYTGCRGAHVSRAEGVRQQQYSCGGEGRWHSQGHHQSARLSVGQGDEGRG